MNASEKKQKTDLAPGMILDQNYQIIKLVGEGGMGSVYRAYDMRLDLEVAIKVISSKFEKTLDDTQSESVLKRFEAEARIAAKIDHPNVIRIYGFKRESIALDVNRCEVDYLIMELLTGRTLRNTMDVSGFEHEKEIRDWIMKYMIPILEGLQKVHASGIVHRDIKPENFLMKGEVPKLADFGLSMGRDLPSVTGSVADIFGSMNYMAPEQFYNFSMAREPADIYSIGKILYEVVEGKISEKAKPFKQAKLSNSDTEFLQALNRVIMDATDENPNLRIPSVDVLKERLMGLLYCGDRVQPADRKPVWILKKIAWASAALSFLTVATILFSSGHLSIFPPAYDPHEVQSPVQEELESIKQTPTPENLKQTLQARDNSVLHLIPPAELELQDAEILGRAKVVLKPFYMAESPVTNQQFVMFLNQIIDRIEVKESSVYLDGTLVLKLSEKIRGYKPIGFENGRFVLNNPMHSACAVLLVTGYGAEAYAKHHGVRLPSAQEWFYVMLTNNRDKERIPLPTPVINYKQDKYGLRGVNQLGEWGKSNSAGLVLLGQNPSSMIEGEFIVEKTIEKYFTDTGFRIALDAG
ncbi:MAG: serine/threonine protein kinase [Desulfobacteraceae bacterium]|nr:MAG: serine/threonine protein kinase [Desulfobacteraceae bacterium]